MDGMDQKDDWHLTEVLDHEQGRGDPFAAAVRATRMSMVITDPNLPGNPIVFVNKAFQDLTGYSREECIGRNCRFMQGPDTDPSAVVKVRRAVEWCEDISIDLLNYRKDGTAFWNALYLSPVRNDDGSVRFFFASQLDITDRIVERDHITHAHASLDDEVARKTTELEAALSAKTVLLTELDHRVKNNLAMIGSIIRLQARQIADKDLAAVLGATITRVDALATVHRHLYQADELLKFDLAEYALNLLSDAARRAGGGSIRILSDHTPCEVDPSHASTLGIVVGEIVHALAIYASRMEGQPVLQFRSDHEGTSARLSFEIADPAFDLDAADGDGLRNVFIDRLSGSSGAEVSIVRGADFTRIIILVQ